MLGRRCLSIFREARYIKSAPFTWIYCMCLLTTAIRFSGLVAFCSYCEPCNWDTLVLY